MEYPERQSKIEQISLSALINSGVELAILREDQLDPEISGNKWRKLKYNVLQAHDLGFDTLLTFGGAFSNHIAAVAAAGKRFGFKTIGVIRGEPVLNKTLKKAQSDGMQLLFVSRSDYRIKHTPEFKEYLKEQFGTFFLIAEGGANYWGINGCMEILTQSHHQFDAVIAACGTGTMLAGLTLSAHSKTHIYGASALKGNFMKDEVTNQLLSYLQNEDAVADYADKFTIWNDAHRGGYAHVDAELAEFIMNFKAETGITLDAIYTGKAMLALVKRAQQNYFKPGTRALFIHSGGIQGNVGVNEQKGFNLPID